MLWPFLGISDYQTLSGLLFGCLVFGCPEFRSIITLKAREACYACYVICFRICSSPVQTSIKTKSFIELEMMWDLWGPKYTPYYLCIFVAGVHSILGISLLFSVQGENTQTKQVFGSEPITSMILLLVLVCLHLFVYCLPIFTSLQKFAWSGIYTHRIIPDLSPPPPPILAFHTQIWLHTHLEDQQAAPPT